MNRGLLLLLIGSALARPALGAPVKIDEPAPPLGLEVLHQAPQGAQATWQALAGQAVVLEFWATWCSPCVTAIPHLNELARGFPDEPIRFISITDEKEETVKAFLEKQPILGWVGLDPDRSAFEAYGVTGMPYTVLVDRKGRIRAITEPGQVTSAVLRDLMAGKNLGIPPPVSFAEAMADLRIPGPEALLGVVVRRSTSARGMMQISPGEFRALGLPLSTLLPNAYDVSRARLVLPEDLPEEPIDVLVMTGQDGTLRDSQLRQALEGAFGLASRVEKREIDVYLLVSTEDALQRLKEGAGEGGGSRTGRGKLEASRISSTDLARSLEAACGRPVIDATGLSGRYEVALTWDADQPESLRRAVRDALGLELKDAKRETELVVVEKK